MIRINHLRIMYSMSLFAETRSSLSFRQRGRNRDQAPAGGSEAAAAAVTVIQSLSDSESGPERPVWAAGKADSLGLSLGGPQPAAAAALSHRDWRSLRGRTGRLSECKCNRHESIVRLLA